MIPAAVDVGNQRGYPDAANCWSDKCYTRINPGQGTDTLGLCPTCRLEIVGRR